MIKTFLRKKLAYLGGISILLKDCLKDIIKKPVLTKEFRDQCLSVGVASMPIAAVTLFFVGVVFAFQLRRWPPPTSALPAGCYL